ncbi:uncharacterized protein C8R40DRAFT_1074619 [Lentinula edodes]|uniref:uncharacterized protein n=1 Tax=Lentinula edodes TaxID=5353 RepID=UPI001E8E14F1|nr:uncharacterized protein C8R40DRAFT_1074619 [Lentinula edodes]KAH7868744.1 hypothetical protein C8R40DRAFT_1074619 [Lentinula edodes]
MQTSSELLKQASHLLRDVCRLVTSVDPPPANLTPHFRQEYIKDLQSLHRNSEMILTWTISLGQILNDLPGKPVDFMLGQYRDGKSSHLASWITPTNTPMPSSDGFQFDASSYDDVDDLTMDVIENIQSEEAKYSLQDLQRRIYHRSETITPQIELDSLRRIIFGYKKATTSDINHSTRPFSKHENTIYDSVSPGGLNHKLQRMTKPPPTFSNEQLLIDHEIFLWEAQATDKCRLWVHSIVHNIIAIDSVRLWGSLDEIEIFAYCEAVSKRLYASQFNAIATNESSTIKGGIKSQQQLVLQCIQNLSSVMARRSLLDKLYKKFGAIALLDSVILHPSSHGQSSPSSFLQRAVPSVIQALEHTPVERTEYWRRRKFVTRLLNMVAFPSTSEYVEDFFNRTVYAKIGNIAPLAANTEPDVRQTFSAGLQALHHKAESLLQWIIAMGQVTVDDQGDPLNLEIGTYTWDPLPEDVAALVSHADSVDEGDEYGTDEDPNDVVDEQLTAQKAPILEVIHDPGRLRFRLQDFRSMVAAAGYKGKVEDQERQAIIRMICGYKLYPTHTMEKELGEHQFVTKSIPKWTSSANNIDNIQVLEDRALAREIFILKDTQNNNVHIWIKCVLRNIQALQLVQEWDTLSPELQLQFRHAVAETYFSDEFARISNYKITERRKKIKRAALYRKFNTHHNKIISRRRKFATLFTMLGPTVLLDPALLHLTQRGYPRSSKYFDRVLAIVIRELENDAFEVEIPWLWEQRRFLLRAVDVIAGSSTFEHIWTM